MVDGDSVVIVTGDLARRIQLQKVIATALGLPTIGMRQVDSLELRSFWAEHDVGLVLVDEGLARAEDYSIVRVIDDLDPGQLVVLLGRNPDDDEVIRAFEAGATDVLALPLQTRETAARLKAVMRGRHRPLPTVPIWSDDLLGRSAGDSGIAPVCGDPFYEDRRDDCEHLSDLDFASGMGRGFRPS